MSRPPGDGAGRGLPPRLDPRAGRARPGEPDPAGPVGRREPAPGRRPASGGRRLVRATRVVAALASFLLLAGSGYGWAAYRSFASGVRHVDAIGASGSDKDGAAQNILLVGDDSRPANASPEVLAQLSTQQDGGSVNTDTIMLLHIPAGGGQATVISFPRDSWVDIPGFGKGKINSAFADGASGGGGDTGGMKLLIQVVQNMTGLSVDHFVKVSLLGFYDIANALGPIQVCLNQAMNDPYSGVNLPAGPSTLNAKQALSFVRQRHGLPRGDLDREVRQQYFLSTELRKVASTGVLLNPGKLNQLLKAVSSALETDPNLDLLQFATQFKNVGAGNVRFATIPITGTPTIQDGNGNDVSIVAVDFTALPAFISQVIGPPSSFTSAPTAAPGSVSVQVLNGTATRGLAATAGQALTALGFTVTGTSTASSNTSITTVTYPAGKEAEAKAVAARVPGVAVAQSSGVSQVTLTLGSDGLTVAAPAAPGAAGQGAASDTSKAPASSSAAAPSAPAKSFDAGSCIN
ncbi:MAG: LytR family transcriptional regulator [Frankiales bacterium]|nr:LytR family transcriptional regulator [Frankiales bacterium]